MFSLWWLPVPNAAAHRLIMSSGESPQPRILRCSYRGALIGSACRQAHILGTEDRIGSAPKAWEHHLVKCAAPRREACRTAARRRPSAEVNNAGEYILILKELDLHARSNFESE